jgi:hypothetical protein
MLRNADVSAPGELSNCKKGDRSSSDWRMARELATAGPGFNGAHTVVRLDHYAMPSDPRWIQACLNRGSEYGCEACTDLDEQLYCNFARMWALRLLPCRLASIANCR